MSLSERLKEPPSRTYGMPCSVGNLLNALEGDELKALKAMLGTPEKPGWDATAIFDAVTAEGYSIGRQSINRHRGRKCRCEQ